MAALAITAAARTAAADADDRAVALALVQSAASLGPATVTAGAIGRTSEELERGTRLRAAGDEANARLADGLAREWAETARDLGLAAATEKMAEDRKRQSMQTHAQLQRTKALASEGIARLGRLQAELDATSPPAKIAAPSPDVQAPAARVPGPADPPPHAGERKADAPVHKAAPAGVDAGSPPPNPAPAPGTTP